MKNNKNDPHWGNSLKSLPWDEKEDPSATEKLLSSTIHEWHKLRHQSASEDELEFINQIPVSACPYCGADKIIKKGFRNGIQKYKCQVCNRKFDALTNTIFEDRKIPLQKWIEYLLYIFEYHSIHSSSRDNRNAESTGRYWLYKVFAVLKNIQKNVMLSGTVYIDEMFFPVVKHETVLKDGKQLRGISRNKICVATGCDCNGNVLLVVEHTSKPSIKSTWNAYGSHIEPGSHLIHDEEKSHSVLIKRLNLTEAKYNSKELKKLEDKDNPLDPVNNLHDLSKRFMRQHGGFNRDELQDWMNLLWFIFSRPENRYEKVGKFLEMAISSPLKVKYRDVMLKNDD